jgi:diguanylate cyclase (GGDEF)-like protein
LIGSMSQRLAGRVAAVLFALTAVGGILEAFQPGSVGSERAGDVVVGLGAVGVAITLWHLPWDRWPRAANLAVAPVALVAIVSSQIWGSFDPFTFGCYFVLMFVWVGVTQRRGTSVMLALAAAGLYLLVTRLRGGGDLELTSVVELTALCVLVGEMLAWFSMERQTADRVDTTHLRAMGALVRAGAMLVSQKDGARVPSIASDLAGQLLRSKAAAVLLPDGDGNFVMAASARWPGPTEAIAVTPSEIPIDLVHPDSDEPAVVEAGTTLLGSHVPAGSHLAFFPLRASGDVVLGVLVVILDTGTRLDRFSENLGASFAAQVGLALERLHTTESLLRQTLRDELTGIGNRRFANSVMSQLGGGDALVMVDLDGFKELNDTHGHLAGDLALQRVGKHMQESLRLGDVAARIGGDEFLIVLRGAGLSAFEIARRLRENWESGGHEVGFSMGIAIHEAGREPRDTLARADAALYEDKHQREDPRALTVPK